MTSSDKSYSLPELEANKPSFRLLQLLLDGEDDNFTTLNFSLRTFELSAAPAYAALSYCWGNPLPSDSRINDAKTFFTEEVRASRQARQEQNWESATHTITVNGISVNLRLNLFEALKNWAEREDENRELLWVDAICIDQKSDVEKSHQVKLMSRIYREASVVRIWLGRADYENEGVRNLLREMNLLYLARYEAGSDGEMGEWPEKLDPLSEEFRHKWGLTESGPALQPPCWLSLIELISRSWFRRRWTLQEVSLARHVVAACGADQYNWQKLRFLAECAGSVAYRSLFTTTWFPGGNMPYWPTAAFGGANWVAAALGNNKFEWQNACVDTYGAFNTATVYTEFLWRCSSHEVTDLRDYFFAIYSLVVTIVGSEDEDFAKIDYSVEAPAIYQRVAELCIRNVPSLAFLSIVQDNTSIEEPGQWIDYWGNRMSPDIIMPSLPSWVPRLAATVLKGKKSRVGLDRTPNSAPMYKTVFVPGACPLRQISGGVLSLKGRLLGSVSACTFPTNTFKEQFLDLIMSLPQSIRGVPAIEALWRSIVFDQERCNHPAPDDMGECLHDFLLHIFLPPPDTPETTTRQKFQRIGQVARRLNNGSMSLPDISPGDPRYHYLAHTNLHDQANQKELGIVKARVDRMTLEAYWDWEFFMTDAGDIGRGSAAQRVGDQIWVLENARVPFMLRPSGRGDQKTYTLVEECFVFGIMNGELLNSGDLVFENLQIV